MKHNFFGLNKIHDESWKNMKFIITCKEENLQKVQRKGLLFGSFSADPESFLERRIEPFSYEQMRYYLKKYCIFEQFNIPPLLVNFLPFDSSQKSNSWGQVQLFEQLIDHYAFREIARVPFMLWVFCRILPKITSEDFERRGAEDSTPTKILSNRFLLDFFVSETIKTHLESTSETMDSSANQKENKVDLEEEEKENQIVDAYIEAINRQAQNFALRSGGYSVNEIKTQGEVIDDPSFLVKLHPLAKWDGNQSQVRFQYPWIREYYIAKNIEEEIREKVPSSALRDEKLAIPRDLLINQRLLTYGSSNSIVLLLLRDAVNDKRLSTEQLMKLIELSREKGGVEQESNFAVAAANAITILNAAGYDFSGQDLSGISIPGANLSYGMFEGTNFRNANLRGVDFTGACLKNANPEQANLENVDFGETLELRLRNEQIFNLAYSFDGRYLAVDVGDQTVIFENAKNDFKEIRRVPGCFLDSECCPFSNDRKQIITVIKKNKEENQSSHHLSFCSWDIISGNPVEKLDIPIGNKALLNFNTRRKEVMALDDKGVKKYSIATDSWSEFPITKGDVATNCELNVKNCDILLMRNSQKKVRLCSALTGKTILKFKQRVTFFKFSPDGKQIVLRTREDFIGMVDTVRGYRIKSLASQQMYDCSFRLIGQRFLATIGDGLVLQDVSDAQTCLQVPLTSASKDSNYNITSKIQVLYLLNNFLRLLFCRPQ